jgi:hypothetical protein
MNLLSRLSIFSAGLFAVCLPAPAAPVDLLPSALRGAVQPQLAVSPDGRVHVVFGKENTIYHCSAPDGRHFSPPVKVGELPELALKMRRGPRVAATDRSIVVTAIARKDGDLHAWVSTDGGTTWRETARLNRVANSAREGLQALAGDGRGLVFATWLDLRSGAMELWGAASRDGGTNWEADHRIYASPDGHICECCHPSVAVTSGKVAVMWRNWQGGSRDLYLSESADGGATWSEAQKFGTGTWPLKGCPMDGGGLAFDPSGKPEAVWRREGTIFLSTTPQMEAQLATNAKQPVLAFSPTGTAIVWENDSNLMLQRGTKPAVPFAKKAVMPAIAARPSGEPVVAWESTATNPPTILVETLP